MSRLDTPDTTPWFPSAWNHDSQDFSTSTTSQTPPPSTRSPLTSSQQHPVNCREPFEVPPDIISQDDADQYSHTTTTGLLTYAPEHTLENISSSPAPGSHVLGSNRFRPSAADDNTFRPENYDRQNRTTPNGLRQDYLGRPAPSIFRYSENFIGLQVPSGLVPLQSITPGNHPRLEQTQSNNDRVALTYRGGGTLVPEFSTERYVHDRELWQIEEEEDEEEEEEEEEEDEDEECELSEQEASRQSSIRPMQRNPDRQYHTLCLPCSSSAEKFESMISMYFSGLTPTQFRQHTQEHGFNCLICYEAYLAPAIEREKLNWASGKPVRTRCGHIFGQDCLWQWFRKENKNSCPICRMKLVPELRTRLRGVYYPYRV